MITTEPGEMMAKFHHRTPVILRRDDVDRWLDPASDPGEMLTLLQHYDEDLIEHFPLGGAPATGSI